jgi:hypothetical protein
MIEGSAMPATNIGPIFIFGSGQRCGSTLLQRLLCTHPDILIWGEHDGVLPGILAGFDRLREWHELFGHHYETYQSSGVVRNFIANMNPPAEYALEAQIQLLRNYWQKPALQLGKTIWGFKEVLYTAEVALKLRELFPTTKVIHITRHPFNCFTSLLHEERLKPGETYVPLKEIWTRARTIEALNMWVKVNHSFLETPGLDESWVYNVTYEQLVRQKAIVVDDLAEWLELNPDDFDMTVFDYKIYTDRHNEEDERPVIEWSDLSAEEYTLLTADAVRAVAERLHYEMPPPRPRQGMIEHHQPVKA